MSAAVKVPHIHAVEIRAFADGFEIEARQNDSHVWGSTNAPGFYSNWQYRVKPELPAKVYPVTGMTDSEFDFICSRDQTSLIEDCRDSANAALRDAYDANEILTLADHQAAIAEFGERLRDAASGREMAIAEAVREACFQIATRRESRITANYIESLDLATIIAKVPTC